MPNAANAARPTSGGLLQSSTATTCGCTSTAWRCSTANAPPRVDRAMAELCSYAQNFEDVMLARALAHVRDGFYIDLGAQHPTVDSVSRAFYELGWRGVHVEPNSAYA